MREIPLTSDSVYAILKIQAGLYVLCKGGILVKMLWKRLLAAAAGAVCMCTAVILP